MSFFRTPVRSHDEKSYGSGFMTRASGFAVVNVDYYSDLMSLEVEPTDTVGTLKGVIYEQTFLPPQMQTLYTCMHGEPSELNDADAIMMVPSASPLSLVIDGDQPMC